MGQTTGAFSSTDVFRRVASKDWVAGAGVSWSPSPSAVRYEVGDYYALRITASSTITISGGVPLEIDYIVVAGGGAGGQRGIAYAPYGVGGGGAGGVLSGTVVLPAGSYTFSIGAGASAATRDNGSPSYIIPTANSNITITAIGGGTGGGSLKWPGNTLGPAYPDTHGQSGGSGGGAAYTVPGGVTESSPQGFPGGPGPSPTGSGTGGGGAGRAGYGPGPNPRLPGPGYPGATGGQGGDGIIVEFTGIPTWVAGGGGGGAYGPMGSSDYWYGGYGGSGSSLAPTQPYGARAGRNYYSTSNGYTASSAGANTGGGGGGSAGDTYPSSNQVPQASTYAPYNNNAGNGGSGVIFIRWKRV